MRHETALPSHYDACAADYDLLNEKRSRILNQGVERELKSRGARTVLDLSCGTGAQLFWLLERGYAVTGADISAAMLAQARKRAESLGLDVTLHQGDMRDAQYGQFDAVLTMFNAIGHLTREDFARAIRNVRANLVPGGTYLFDIFDADYLREGDHIASLTIDWVESAGPERSRKIQYSTVDDAGVLLSHTVAINAEGEQRSSQSLQIYTADELRAVLTENGFGKVVVERMTEDDAPGQAPSRLLVCAEAAVGVVDG